MDQHMKNLEIIIDDVHFVMVDKHHIYPIRKEIKIKIFNRKK
jgi:hypothetical protein